MKVHAESEEAKQTKARKAIEKEMKAVTALIKAGEFETEMGNNHSRASIDFSERKRSMVKYLIILGPTFLDVELYWEVKKLLRSKVLGSRNVG